MSERLGTWGEVVAAAGIAAGDTPADAPVERLMSVASVGSSSGAGFERGPAGGFGGCGAGCACAHEA